ncbi:hypothetical protein BDN72DRAFT_778922 [Pluteus cervinus]|uniref:Uncharacterized protein n=1 Tax=Pluteus cervinus TaxID=181527 RepID=A0ACD3A615_9AGAR|nr:hypothetical protein BDN72DRAFT_778922 [Pluteus cervinus]
MPRWENCHTLQYTKTPASWRLVNQNKGNGEEIVFTIQGVIEHKSLPPIPGDRKSRPLTPFRIVSSKPHLLQQSVTLTGLGTESFESSIEALIKIHNVLSHEFPEGKLTAWQPATTGWTSGRGLTLTNRYFTNRSEGSGMQNVPFSTDVDPKGVLTKMLNNKLIHTKENEVKHYTRYSDLGNNFRYLKSKPQFFRVGDIVEIQFSLVVFQMRTEQYILKPMLYSIALLDGQYGNVSFHGSTNHSFLNAPISGTGTT